MATASRVRPRARYAKPDPARTAARSTSSLSETRSLKGKAKALNVKTEASFSSASTNSSIDGPCDGLPEFARVKWSTSFLPTLYACLGSASNPWKLYEEGSSMVDTIQGVLDMVYPNSGYRVKLGDRIFSMVRMAPTASILKETNTLLG
jgi:hypothetical protein